MTVLITSMMGMSGLLPTTRSPTNHALTFTKAPDRFLLRPSTWWWSICIARRATQQLDSVGNHNEQLNEFCQCQGLDDWQSTVHWSKRRTISRLWVNKLGTTWWESWKTNLAKRNKLKLSCMTCNEAEIAKNKISSRRFWLNSEWSSLIHDCGVET